MKTYIKGNYRKSIYKNDKGYVIGLFKVRDTNIDEMIIYQNKTITFTGFFHELNNDDTYIFYGEPITHERYGFQFQVTEYERIKPEDKDGIIEFLASDLFPGIGEKMATTIVSILGENTLDCILEDKNCLALVPKLSTKKADKIYDTLTKYEQSHKIVVYLTELGFSMKDSLDIYNYYKNETIDKIENNIYSILNDIEDISFTKIDEIGLNQNIKPDDPRRLKATIYYIMTKLTYTNGDTYLDKESIIKNVNSYLKQEIDYSTYEQLFSELVSDLKIKIIDNKYYLKTLYDAETNIINKIRILNNKESMKIKRLNDYLKTLEEESKITYNDNQKIAIRKALESNLLIITGGPGTGKTTIIKAITTLYKMINDLTDEELVTEVALLAPTGRASKRMSEATILPAMTIHRFLKWNKENNQFSINETNKDFSKLIIIDEVSMIDTMLLDSLFKGITDNAKVIFVGDYNQLPSVGPGQILKDLIKSEVVDTVYLDLLYRQDENSYINNLAIEIKDNNLSENYLKTKSDYTFLRCSANSIIPNLRTLCHQINNKDFDYKQVQIMAPMYAGINGIDSLNKNLQDVFNPRDGSKNEYISGDIVYRENDKILQLVNMPDENVFNGDIGIIKHIIKNNNVTELHIDFDGNIVIYKLKDLHKIKHGYAISIHKSQGSEFDLVVMVISNSFKRMLYRKLVYTGITRAKKKLIIIGEDEAFIYSVNNDNEYIRNTSLLENLVYMYK